jgi:hypothetical protein
VFILGVFLSDGAAMARYELLSTRPIVGIGFIIDLQQLGQRGYS